MIFANTSEIFAPSGFNKYEIKGSMVINLLDYGVSCIPDINQVVSCKLHCLNFGEKIGSGVIIIVGGVSLTSADHFSKFDLSKTLFLITKSRNA